MSKNLKIVLLVGAFWVLFIGAVLLIFAQPKIAFLFCGSVFGLVFGVLITAFLVGFLDAILS